MKDFDAEIAKRRKEIEEIEKERDRYNSLSTNQKLAEYLHEKFCHVSHDDSCDWFYENDWNKPTHQYWADMVNNIILFYKKTIMVSK